MAERTYKPGKPACLDTVLAPSPSPLRRGSAGPGGDQITRIHRSRRAHSYLLVFSKRRLRRKMESQ